MFVEWKLDTWYTVSVNCKLIVLCFYKSSPRISDGMKKKLREKKKKLLENVKKVKENLRGRAGFAEEKVMINNWIEHLSDERFPKLSYETKSQVVHTISEANTYIKDCISAGNHKIKHHKNKWYVFNIQLTLQPGGPYK